MTTLLGQKPQQKKHKQYVDQNPIEAVRDIGSAVAESGKDLATHMGGSFINQLLGIDSYGSDQQSHGELSEGQEIDLLEFSKKTEKAAQHIEAAIDYTREILHGEQGVAKVENRELQASIQQIQLEIKQIMDTSKELAVTFKDVEVQSAPVKVGRYHKHFFAWLLTTLQQARMKVQDSANCLAVVGSKSRKKGYWNMFKKHGTTFGMSNERVVATQTG